MAMQLGILRHALLSADSGIGSRAAERLAGHESKFKPPDAPPAGPRSVAGHGRS